MSFVPAPDGTRPNTLGALFPDSTPAGFTEAEYLLSGEATGRDDADGSDHTEAFMTRVLVRRPTDPSRFNGTVVVEWLNCSAGFEVFVGWPSMQDVIVREGYAWVGISAQPISVSFLRSWDPVRYAELTHPWRQEGDLPTFVVGETFSDDIFTAVGHALRGEEGVLLLGRRPEKLLAYGTSQSCGRLGDYVHAAAPDNPYDGALMQAFQTTFSTFGTEREWPDEPLRVGSATLPVVHVNSEAEALIGQGGPPDDDHYRYWEVPGSQHGPRLADAPNRRYGERDLVLVGLGYIPPESRAVVSIEYVVSAALTQLDRWSRSGVAPPSFERISVRRELPPQEQSFTTPLGTTTRMVRHMELERDEYGNAVGGIRLPHVEVPLGRHFGPRPFETAALEPFDEDKLARLYPTRDAYVEQVEKAAQRCVEQGAMLPADATRVIDEARAVPRRPLARLTPDPVGHRTAPATADVEFAVLRRLQPFDVKLHYTDRHRLEEAVEQELGLVYHASAESLVEVCDVVTINAPLHPETEGLFDDRLIARMKRGAYLINTARGKICDRDAVVRALESGQLAGYAGDVWFPQPAPVDHPWRSMPHHVADPTAANNTLITGGADAFIPPTKLLLDQAEAAGAKVLPYRTNAVSFRSIYLFNLQRAPFNDPIARQALTMALDPKKIAAPRDAPTANNISDTDSIWYAKEGALPKYDPKKAQDLINQWSQKNGGKPLEFTVTDIIGQAAAGGSGEAIQAAMSSYQNVKVNVEMVTIAQYGVIGPQGNFDLYPSAFGGADPSNVFDQNFQTGAGRNYAKDPRG